nr:hypothetical protein [Tanacetum cinerariifolium]
METEGGGAQTLHSCLASKLRSIDGKVLRKDGKPMKAYRQVMFGVEASSHVEPIMLSQQVTRTNDGRVNLKVHFREILNCDKTEHSDFVLPIAAVHAVKHKFNNSLVGFFVGKKEAFPLVKNYVTNTWAKFGFVQVINDDDGVFYFKFATSEGLEQVLGKDGKPMKAYRQVMFGVEASSHVKPIMPSQQVLGKDGKPMKAYRQVMFGVEASSHVKPIMPSQQVTRTNDGRVNLKVHFREILNYDKTEHSDFVLPIAAVHAVINDDDGVFYFKFATSEGLEQVLEQGPWMIRNVPLILTKWSPNMSLDKEKVTKVPVWVKFHRVPVVAYSKALIKVNADKELKTEVVMAVPNFEDEGLTHTLETVRVEYEWKLPLCIECHVFGHTADQCPKNIVEKPSTSVMKDGDGFTTVVNRKNKGKAPVSWQKKATGGFKV